MGASTIQGSIFVPVAADYSVLSYDDAAARGMRMMKKERAKQLYGFPSKAEAANWKFIGRNDMTTGAPTANLVGIEILTNVQQAAGYSDTAGTDVTFSDTGHNVTVSNWVMASRTRNNGDAYIRTFRQSHVGMYIPDDEYGNMMLGSSDEEAHMVFETLGFLLKANAAAYPTLEPVTRLLNGVYPLA